MQKYDYQPLAISHAVEFLRHAKPGERQLYAAPTGTGKSYMELGIMSQCPDAWLLTPRVEIGFDMLRKKDASLPLTEETLHEHRISTPIVFRNRLLSGTWRSPPQLIIDEAHHHTAETFQLIDLLCGMCPSVGFTATPYRVTPRSSAEFRKQWGEPLWILTYPEAIVKQVLSMPRCEIVPLIDDDKVKVVNGQFEVESLESETKDRLFDAVQLLQPFFRGSTWDRPTMVSVPSRSLARDFTNLANQQSLPCLVVDGDTSPRERQNAFDGCVYRNIALVQIQVVSEGVDLPIRRLLDLHPMISPVEWLQQFGRITRPSDEAPHYICCNRNLLRHAYLLEGCLPPEIVAQGDKLFGGPSSRLGTRGIGLEALGRFKGIEVPFADGTTGACYSVSTCEGSTTRQYTCIVHPMRSEPLWAVRVNQRTDDPMKPHYGRWSRCEPPLDLSGFASVPPAPITEKMTAWWIRDAAKRGLDASAKVTRKNFTVLPVLTDLRVRL